MTFDLRSQDFSPVVGFVCWRACGAFTGVSHGVLAARATSLNSKWITCFFCPSEFTFTDSRPLLVLRMATCSSFQVKAVSVWRRTTLKASGPYVNISSCFYLSVLSVPFLNVMFSQRCACGLVRFRHKKHIIFKTETPEFVSTNMTGNHPEHLSNHIVNPLDLQTDCLQHLFKRLSWTRTLDIVVHGLIVTKSGS